VSIGKAIAKLSNGPCGIDLTVLELERKFTEQFFHKLLLLLSNCTSIEEFSVPTTQRKNEKQGSWLL